MTGSTQPGVWFQDLTAIIEKAFVGDSFTEVKSPAYLPELTSGELREFDVLITRTQHHNITRTAIECKDHSRRVGVAIVEGFAPKSRGCGVHRAIIVSKLGFTSGAYRKASELGIDCMTLMPAKPDNVRVTVSLHHRHVTFLAAHYGVPAAARLAQPYGVFRSTGELVSNPFMASLATQYVPPPDEIERATGLRNYRITLEGDGGLYLIDANGERFEPTEVLLDVTCNYGAEPMPIENYLYSGGGAKYVISMARDFTADGAEGRAIFIDDEAGFRGGFVPFPKA